MILPRLSTAWPRVLGALFAALFLAFDAVTILPVLTGVYVIKRALRIDVIPGLDTLPDPLIGGFLAALANRIRSGF